MQSFRITSGIDIIGRRTEFQRILILILSLLILPRFLGVTGAWLAIPVAEFLTLVLTLGMHQTYFRKPGERNYLL